MTCTHCNAQLEDGAAFCEECGTQVVTDTAFCESCGAELESGAAFCDACGAAIGINTASETATPTTTATATAATPAKTAVTPDAYTKVKVTKEAREQAKKHADSGFEHWRVHDYKAAAADYAKAAELDPNNHDYFYRVGLSLEQLRDYDKAIDAFTEASRRKPADTSNYTCRARVWAAKGDYAAALADYDAAIGLDPYMTFFYYERGNVLMAMKNFKAAYESYSTAYRGDTRNKAYKEKMEEAKRLNEQ